MIPLGYYLPPFLETKFTDLANANGVSTRVSVDQDQIYTLDGQLAFSLKDGFLKSFYVLDEEFDMRLHAALIASGAKHSGAEALRRWPGRFLVNDQLFDWHSLDLAEAGIILSEGKSLSVAIAESEFWLGVRIGGQGAASSFVTKSLHNKSKALNECWDFLKNKLQTVGFAEMSRNDLEVCGQK